MWLLAKLSNVISKSSFNAELEFSVLKWISTSVGKLVKDHGRPWSFDRKKDHGRSRGQKKTMVKDHLVNDQMVIYQKRPVRPVFLKKMGYVYL